MPTPARGDACPGALRLHEAADGHLARVRIPGGLLQASQATALARAAEDLGDAHLDLTSRGNVQLRALPADAGQELAARLAGRLCSRPPPTSGYATSSRPLCRAWTTRATRT